MLDLNNRNQVLDNTGRIWTTENGPDHMFPVPSSSNDNGQILSRRSSGVLYKFYPERIDPETFESGVYDTEEHQWAYLDDTPLLSAYDNDDSDSVPDNASSHPTSLNNNGQVVGTTDDGPSGYGSTNRCAFRWQTNNMAVLADFGIESAEEIIENAPTAINDNGTIIGIGQTTPYPGGIEGYVDQGGSRILFGDYLPVSFNNEAHVLVRGDYGEGASGLCLPEYESIVDLCSLSTG